MSEDWIPIPMMDVDIDDGDSNSSSSSGRIFNLLQRQYGPDAPRTPTPPPPQTTESKIEFTNRWLNTHERFFIYSDFYLYRSLQQQNVQLTPEQMQLFEHFQRQMLELQNLYDPHQVGDGQALHDFQPILPIQMPGTEQSPQHSSLMISPQLSPLSDQSPLNPDEPQPGCSFRMPGEIKPSPRQEAEAMETSSRCSIQEPQGFIAEAPAEAQIEAPAEVPPEDPADVQVDYVPPEKRARQADPSMDQD